VAVGRSVGMMAVSVGGAVVGDGAGSVGVGAGAGELQEIKTREMMIESPRRE